MEAGEVHRTSDLIGEAPTVADLTSAAESCLTLLLLRRR
jgi:hypothetical protein